MAVQIQLRRDTASNWTGTNPVLAIGEPGVETDTLKVKVGNGVTAWNSLDYSISNDYGDLLNTPTTLAGYGITDALTLTSLSVGAEATAAGDGAIAYNNATGAFTYTPPDTSTFLTSVAYADLTTTPTTLSGYGITDAVASSAISTFGGTLVDDADASAARTTLGLGTAATTAATAYATAAQGTTADSAIQPNTSPTLTNATLTGYLAGPASFVIDPAAVGDDTGTVVIAGNLQVDGVQTTINSTTVAIDDLNFSIATDAADSAAANGAGISIGGAGATLVYTHATTSWDLNKQVNISENLSVGATPKAMQSGFDNIQVGGNLTLNVDSTGAGAGVYMGNNVYRDVTDSRWEYIYTDEASQYVQANGEHLFRQASSGTANDPITWTTPLKIDSSGNVGIGTDAPDTELHVFNSDSGATPTSNTVATFEGNDNTEISILGGSSSILALNFGHSGDNNEGIVYFNTTSGSENLQLQSTKDITLVATSANGTAGDINFKSYNTTIMHVDGGNNRVGIGTDAPSETFHVQKAADDKLVYGSNPRLLLDTPTGINGLRVTGDTTPFEFKIDSGTYNGSAFQMGGTGDLSFIGTTTTASDTFNDSPTFFFNSMRWNGSANSTHFQGAIKGHTRSATNGDGYLGIGASASANHLNIETDGTVGVGTTDLDSWSTVFDGRIRLGATGFVGSTSASTQLGNNWYYDGSAYKRIASDLALRYYQNGGDHVWETAVTGAADSTITWATKMFLGSNGNLEIGYAGAARQQADSQALSIITPASGGGQGIALKRLDSNNDQNLGEISWSNNTQDGLGSISVKTDGAVNTTQMNFEVAVGGSAIFPLKLEGGPNTVVINGTTADHSGTTGASRGLSVATAGGTSCPIYFGSETDAAQKSIYLNSYWMYLRGHQNEGIRFVFSQGANTAIRSDQYEFKYNSATRPTGNTTWDGFSDARAKENVQNITGALDTISQLRPVVFDWTDDYADTMNMFEMDKTDAKSYNWKSIKENGYDLTRKNGKLGFIAQEFETVFPKDITELEVQLGDEKVEDFKTVNYDSLIPTLTKAIQEQQAQIQALQQRLDDLEG